MVSEQSPRSRRLSKAMGCVVAYAILFAVFSVFGGVIVGFVATSWSGMSSDARRVTGLILLILSIPVGVTALIFMGLRFGSRRAARSPRRELQVFAPRRGYQVFGTIANAPVFLAPLSQRPCVLWHIALRQSQAISEASSGWVAVWSQSRIGDVEIRYDRTKTIDAPRPGTSEKEHTLTLGPGGTITIAGGSIQFTQLPFDRHQTQIFPLDMANLLALENEGLPAKLREDSAAKPKAYRLTEYCLTTGDFVRGTQQSTIASEHWIPDPDAPFQMATFSQEQGDTMLLGCLVLQQQMPRMCTKIGL